MFGWWTLTLSQPRQRRDLRRRRPRCLLSPSRGLANAGSDHTSRSTVNKRPRCTPGHVPRPEHPRGHLSAVCYHAGGQDRVPNYDVCLFVCLFFLGRNQTWGFFCASTRRSDRCGALARNGLVRRTTRHLWVSKIKPHRVISRHHLVQFFRDPYELFLSSHRGIYPRGECGSGAGKQKINAGGESWWKLGVWIRKVGLYAQRAPFSPGACPAAGSNLTSATHDN